MRHTIPFAIMLLLMASCGSKKDETQETPQQEQDINAVRSLSNYNYTDSLNQGSHKVIYTITRQPDDELPIVVDEDGLKYKDNRYTLVIIKDGSTFFNKSFTKNDFKTKLPKDFIKYGIMDGLRFDRAEEGKLYFFATVTYPELDDMSRPFILTIGPDGSHQIEIDTSPDMEVPETARVDESDV